MKRDYDAIVVGVGPAGSMAYMVAVRRGRDVLPIEKRRETGSPVKCAECVTGYDLVKLLETDTKWICASIRRTHAYSPDGTVPGFSCKAQGDEAGHIPERAKFDLGLTKTASRAGAEVMVKTLDTSLLIEDGFVAVIRDWWGQLRGHSKGRSRCRWYRIPYRNALRSMIKRYETRGQDD